MKIILIIGCIFISTIFSSTINLNKLKNKENFERISLNEALDLILESPDELLLTDIIIILSQNAYLEIYESPLKPDNFDELWNNWVYDILKKLINSSSEVTIGELKPYITALGETNSTKVINAIEAINSILFKNDSSSDIIDVLLNAPNDFTLDELLVLVTQNFFLDIIESGNIPDNFDELKDIWIEVLTKLRTNGTDSVSLGELKPIINAILPLFQTFSTIIVNNTSALLTSTYLQDSTTMETFSESSTSEIIYKTTEEIKSSEDYVNNITSSKITTTSTSDSTTSNSATSETTGVPITTPTIQTTTSTTTSSPIATSSITTTITSSFTKTTTLFSDYTTPVDAITTKDFNLTTYSGVVTNYYTVSPIEFNLINLINDLLSIPNELTLDELLIIVTQNIILETESSPQKPDNLYELITNWINILSLLRDNGTGFVEIGVLKPYISILGSVNTPTTVGIITTLNSILFKNDSSSDIIDVLLNVPDDFTLDELLVLVTQNVFLDIIESGNIPDNFNQLKDIWIEILLKLRTNGTSSVTIGHIKPILNAVLNNLNVQSTTTIITTTTTGTTSKVTTTSTSSSSTTSNTTKSNVEQSSTTSNTTKSNVEQSSTTKGTISVQNTTTTSTVTKSNESASLSSTNNLGLSVALPIASAIILTLLIILILYLIKKKKISVSIDEESNEQATTKF